MKVLIFGTFDQLHPGHRFVLDRAQTRGDLTVVVARDANVLRIKGRPPVEDETVRRRAVATACPNARVLLGDSEDFLAPVREIAPDRILLGFDQHLPPGVMESHLPCPVERLPPFAPHLHKSTLRRQQLRKRGKQGGQR